MDLTRFFQTAPVHPDIIEQSLWMIIALPLLGAFICGVFGRMMGRANVHLVACAAVAGSFVLSVLAFWATSHIVGFTPEGNPIPISVENTFGGLPTRYAISQDLGTWFIAGDFRVNFGFLVDHLSGTLLLVITGVGFLIHLYSTSYMEHDEGYWRYFAYLNLFVAMMLTLVMADNLVLLFVGWEGVGMASYLLIGFWYTDAAKAWAGRKAFITNRIGDFAFLIATFLIVLLVGAFGKQAAEADLRSARSSLSTYSTGLSERGPVTFQGLEKFALAVPGAEGAVNLETQVSSGPLTGYSYGGVLTVALLLFLLGAAGKSAQLPLYVWLPDAMAGPTPVSALIHAATMVTAGVYLFCRMSFMLVLSPTAMAAVAIVGAATALLAALIAFAQDDIKKVLAYSTVSQLGLMFLGVGMGAFWAAALHLVTHAFFKACLFLGAGSVMHGNGDETDIKKLGGVRKHMKVTWLTFATATAAITGIIPLSGFFSKDAIFHGVSHNHLHGLEGLSKVLFGVGLLVALCTAFYMSRLYLLTFHGKRAADARVTEDHVHESARPMTVPLVLLALASIFAFAYAFPLFKMGGRKDQLIMENFLSPVFDPATTIAGAAGTVQFAHTPAGFMDYLIAWIVAVAGGLAAWFLYMKYFPSRAGQPEPAWLRPMRRVAVNKFYVDEAYEFAVIRPVKFVSFVLFRVVDALIIDTVLVRGTAWVTARVGSALRYVQTGDAQAYAAVMALALLGGLLYAIL
jgi:NADH-quinone oxidoreductase subunit L